MRIRGKHMQKVTKYLILSERSYRVFAPQSFVTKCFLIFIVDEVKNFVANNLLQVGVLVMYWEPCITGLSCSRIRAKRWHSYTEEFIGFEAVESFYYKFIYGDCRVQGQMFCTRSETSLYYSGLLFGKVSPQVFTVSNTPNISSIIGKVNFNIYIYIYIYIIGIVFISTGHRYNQ